jgi:superfamily II DNA or RNA helicase
MAAMSAPVLRDYQFSSVQRIRTAYASGRRRVLFQLPTGAGKTICFAYVLASAAKRGSRVLVLAHRVEILEQIEAALELAGVKYGIIAPGHPETDDAVQIASIAALAHVHRLRRWRDRFDFIVVDECHHAVAGSWARVLASQPRAAILGVTATPERLDGKGLGEIFDDMVVGPSTAELIKAEWLSPFVAFEPVKAPDLNGAKIRAGDFAIEDIRDAMGGVVIGAAVDEYARLCPGVPAVAFCVDRAHSEAVAERFRAGGRRAAHVDGETPANDRRNAIASLGNGGLDVLCNCGLISEGVDVPAIGAAILLRPTASVALYLQQVGRALRPSPGKDRAIILDFAGNVAGHGLPDEPRAWSLDAKPTKQRERSDGRRLRRCKACRALNRAGAHRCVECGADLRTPRERAEVEIALRQARQREDEDLVRSLTYRDRLSWAGSDKWRLQLIERVCGYKSGWAWHRAREVAAQSTTRAANG